MTSAAFRTMAGAIIGSVFFVAPAQAQLGGLMGKAKSAAGLGSSGSQAGTMSGDEADAFLEASFRSTKNVLIATTLILQAVEKRGPLTGLKTRINAINSTSDPKEIGSFKSALSANLQALDNRKEFAGDFQTAYQAASAEEKKVLGIAVLNLAIGIARNVDLVGKAPQVVDAIKGNPKLLMRAGQFKTAAELVALQGKGLAGISTSVPKLLAAAKVRAPKDAKTTNETPVTL
ncbi:hypothetical protein GCM10022280_18920 [Sphingomonas swuensis]|uniref:DUF4142 domain-containing protein n=1 Tax=Sphingomonas swuensis TaxID=977800 RepID=A0ABP7T0P0_9SPHN